VRRAAAIMVQGTGSDVGKSLLVAGLGRAFSRRGLAVRPFKPQNMSNNAAVAADGGEIGRAQALQARACGLAPSIHMNPVLLKPQTDIGAQVVLQGQVWGTVAAADYLSLKAHLLPKVLASFECLSEGADLVLVEGAGSPAEVNLRAGDIANMGFAEAADLPVVLVGDIDRGGVIASLVGTWALLSETERARLAGVIINKFRGDVRLFDGGLTAIKERTGLPCLGVVPHFPAASRLPAEDSMALASPAGETGARARVSGAVLRVAVPVLARIANFDDLDPLIAEPDVEVVFVQAGMPLPGDADLVLLPGSKATLSDLAYVRSQGWDIDIAAHVRRGGWLLGLCGGYQMLGRHLRDPNGIEGPAGEVPGLGLLDVETEIGAAKRLAEVSGLDHASGAPVSGYEMHMGTTDGPGRARPLLHLGERPEGTVSPDGRVMGCYLHGLFAADEFRRAFLSRLAGRAIGGVSFEVEVERVLDALADHLETYLDLDALLAVARRRDMA